ncbi:MAG: hypothetical protein HY518_01170 [Candidatus Aenigmarchaeota archaeon]|nr:hypothetical protein [Candidatus Aenigmarchaeota archaeon]
MGKIEIREDCLAPERFIYLSYEGPDPWGVAKNITATIRPFFHVSASGTSQTKLYWDVVGDPIKFYSTWWVKKALSAYTFFRVDIKVQGDKSKTGNKGRFTLQLSGDLNTNFGGWGIFVKPVWLMYSYLFYSRVRRKFIMQCSDYITGFRNEIKEHFNLKAAQKIGSDTALG